MNCDPIIHLIVGLGNPGIKYETTRHNIGFMVIDSLLDDFPSIPAFPVRNCLLSKIKMKGREILLQKPINYMNCSGESVFQVCKKKDFSPTNLFVIYDDIDLPLGKLRIRRGGGSGGHKGVESIINSLGTKTFNRLRIGIKSLRYSEEQTSSFVLSSFHQNEWDVVKEVVSLARNCIVDVICRGVSATMNNYNGLSVGTI